MGIETTGKLHAIFETRQVSERFTKREFVIELADNPKYPQLVLFQLTGDRCHQLDDLQVGDNVRVDFSLRGREWKSPKGEVKYFNSLDAWSIERAAPGASAGGGRRDQRDSRGDRGDPRDARGDFRGGGDRDFRDPRGGGGAPRGGDPRDFSDAPPRDDDDRPIGRSRDDEDIPF